MNSEKNAQKKDIPSNSKKQWSKPALYSLDIAETATPSFRKSADGGDGWDSKHYGCSG